MEPEEKGSALPAILLVVAVVSVGMALFASAGIFEPTKPAVAKPIAVMKPTPVTPTFQLGEIVTVKASRTDFTLSVTTEIAATVDRLCLAGDEEGLGRLIYAKLTFVGAPGSHVRIIGFDANPEATRRLGCDKTWVQARFVDGNYEGVAGWADAEALMR